MKKIISVIGLVGQLLAQTTPLMTPDPHRVTSRQKLEAAAQAFANQGYFASSEEVVTAVFGVSHYLQVPKLVQDLVSHRLVSAEDSYWRGQSPGVQEREPVAAFNSLVIRLNLPTFAETNPDQMRLLRMQVAGRSPTFMARNIAKADMKIGDSIESAMSPLQALHLVLCLIDQKFYNPVFQVTNEEWPQSRAQYEASLADMGTQFSIRAIPPEKPTELRQRLDSALSSMSDADGLELLKGLEHTFGI